MISSASAEAFFESFCSYLTSIGFLKEKIHLTIDAYKVIDADQALSQQLLALDVNSLPEDISFQHLSYIFLNAVANNDLGRTEKCWRIAVSKQNHMLRSGVAWLALAYDPGANKFSTDYLLFCLTQLLIDKKCACSDVESFLSAAFFKRDEDEKYKFDNYQLSKAIDLVKVIINFSSRTISYEECYALRFAFSCKTPSSNNAISVLRMENIYSINLQYNWIVIGSK